MGLRYALLYSGSLISGAFSGLISAGITGNMDGLHGLRAWRWLFIIEGVHVSKIYQRKVLANTKIDYHSWNRICGHLRPSKLSAHYKVAY